MKLSSWYGRVLGLALAATALLVQAEDPNAIRRNLASLSNDAQADWLDKAYHDATLTHMSGPELDAVLASTRWEAWLSMLRRNDRAAPEYETLMLRQERMGKTLPSEPERMLVRYRHSPRAVYARWLDGGPRSGQEVIYDEKVDAGSMLAHLGGLLGAVSTRNAIDGMIARAQSRHTVRHLGFAFILDEFQKDYDLLKANGKPTDPVERKVVGEGAKRMIEFRFVTPGQPTYYASDSRLTVDLAQPLIRVTESRDAKGEVFERIVFERIEHKKLAANTFSPENPEYRF
ncbi:DUF1571 domain-containing protein [Chitinivorax sp. PXF-14]|uniref:DUF1571 domain-containing protein n=1 Tax=Chitinivorax sp. PXF-14 TaxID=3230488 RepID=UPI0034651B88